MPKNERKTVLANQTNKNKKKTVLIFGAKFNQLFLALFLKKKMSNGEFCFFFFIQNVAEIVDHLRNQANPS